MRIRRSRTPSPERLEPAPEAMAAIRRAEELGFLRIFGPPESETFEIMRILKARFGPMELQDVKDRLTRYAERED